MSTVRSLTDKARAERSLIDKIKSIASQKGLSVLIELLFIRFVERSKVEPLFGLIKRVRDLETFSAKVADFLEEERFDIHSKINKVEATLSRIGTPEDNILEEASTVRVVDVEIVQVADANGNYVLQEELPEWMDTNYAGKMLRVTKGTVASLCRSGKLHATKVGTVWRVHRGSLVQYIRNHRPSRYKVSSMKRILKSNKASTPKTEIIKYRKTNG